MQENQNIEWKESWIYENIKIISDCLNYKLPESIINRILQLLH